jgi:hypothetical protein
LTQKASPNDAVMIPTSANGQPRDALPPSGVQMELHVPADQEAVHPLWVMVGVEREVVGLLKEFGEHGAGLDARQGGSDAEVDADPQIHPFCTPTRKLGGDVADFTYRQAWIDGDHAYRISGKRGTARWLNVTVQGPRPDHIPGTDWPSLHEPFGDIPETNIFGNQITTEADGSFELYVGGEVRAENWLPTTSGSRKLFIREAFDAWFETPTTLSIERIGMDGPRPIPTPERIIQAMEWAGDFLTGAMHDWPEHSWNYSTGVCDPAFTNHFPPERTANSDDDAKRGRLAAHMIWELKPDEALIVEMDNHDGFWIFGMGNVFAASMDFLYRPVSYTPARTKVDSDDVVRLVIAHEILACTTGLTPRAFRTATSPIAI